MHLGREFVLTVNQIAETRNIDRGEIISSLKAALESACKKHQGSTSNSNSNSNVEVDINTETGDIELSELKTVVKDADALTSPDTQITLKDAKALGFYDAKEGEVLKIAKDFSSFGRIAAQTARQVVIQHLKDAERKVISEEFKGKLHEIMPGVIFKADYPDQVLVRLSDRTEATLPKREQIPGEVYKLGEKLQFLVYEVRDDTRGPKIIVSRTHPRLLKKLMEREVPEIREGALEIKDVVREAGVRSKVSLEVHDINVDPIGACVGSSGLRIKNISDELKGEKVDIITWSDDPASYIRSALAPAQIAKVDIISDKEPNKSAKVYVYPDQLSLAIGKAGQNVRLAARLTGWKIDIAALAGEKMPTIQDLFHDVNEVN